MTHRVIFTPEAEDQLDQLFTYLAIRADPETAAQFIEAVIQHCEDIALFPMSGRPRDYIRPGLRITTFRKRTVIAYAEVHGELAILGIFHGGRDYEAGLSTP